MVEQQQARERPILFSGEMVRIILEGRKTQTRRVIKFANMNPSGAPVDWADAVYPAAERGWIAWKGATPPGPDLAAFTKRQYRSGFACPYGQAGDRLWVRETWCQHPALGIVYRADTHDAPAAPGGYPWRPSIYMPRWASRLMLEIMSIRVERLQSITWDDCIAEGIDTAPDGGNVVEGFRLRWNTINAKRGYEWERNPWVWVVGFERMLP